MYVCSIVVFVVVVVVVVNYHIVDPQTMPERYTRVKLRNITKNTSEWSPFRRMWEFYSQTAIAMGAMPGLDLGIDPFARNCEWAFPMTNDINPNTRANYNLDAEDFLAVCEEQQTRYWVGLLDPPFSDRQSKEAYGTTNLYAADSGKMSRISKIMGRMIRHRGFIIKAGFNTNPPAANFELVEVCLVTLGGNRNDVLFSVWQKTTPTLQEWSEEE